MDIGARTHGLSRAPGNKVTSACRVVSPKPGKLGIRQTIACSPGSYLARPRNKVKAAEAVVEGTGILITT